MQQCPQCQAQNTDTAFFCQTCGHSLGPRTQATGALPADAVLHSRYVIVKLLGRGGMGAVYQATDLRLPGALWAIKEMSDSALTDPTEKQQAIAAFEQEAQLLAALSHPNLPKVVDFFSQANKQYLVMEYIDGRTLEQVIDDTSGFLDQDQVLDWAGQVCDVLTYLHSQQPPVIFRDLKPSNIMVDQQYRVKLIDFGIVRHFKPGQTSDTVPMGTPGYTPPEGYGQAQTDARSDVYSLGVTLHRLLTRHDPCQTPFQLPPVRSLAPDTSSQIEEVIQRATHMYPAQRYPSAAEMKRALIQPAPKPAAPPPPPGSGPLSSRPLNIQRVAPFLVGGAILLCIVLVAASLTLGGGFLPGGTGVTPPSSVAAGSRASTGSIAAATPRGGGTSTPSSGAGGGVSPSSSRKPSDTPIPTPSRIPSHTPVPMPSRTPTLTPIPTPSRTPTPTATALPTVTPTPACSTKPQGLFAGLWQTYRDQLGCPLQTNPQVTNDAEQLFQNGHMFWRSDNDYAYVVYEQGPQAGTFQAFTGLWYEGNPDYSCAASPPAGLIQPKRGFGGAWCLLGGPNAPIGWALGDEVGFGPGNGDPLVQDFERGIVFRDSDGKSRGMAYVMFENETFVRIRY
jgi:serine/threonine-protein kinase